LEKKFLWLYRFLVDYWNSLLAGLSVVAILVFTIIPGLHQYALIFGAICANAVVWIIIEMKVKLSAGEGRTSLIYPSMVQARTQIVRAMIDTAVVARGRSTKYRCVGGRIISMSDIVIEFLRLVESGECVCSNVSIEVYCMSPDFLRQLRLPGALGPDQQHDKNNNYASIVESFRRELEGAAKSVNLIDRGISVNVFYYDSEPTAYWYLLGDRRLFWGGFTWIPESSNLEGAGNPCFDLDVGNPEFPKIYEWLSNRTDLYQARAKP
jgi:hypothetical protein